MTASVDWFGADIEENEERKTTTAVLDGFRGVDSDVPKTIQGPDGTLTRALVRKPAPRVMSVKTVGRDQEIARLTARYKLCRSAFQFAPLDDKELWERRRDIAFAEMQAARFRQKLERYQATPDARPEQVAHLRGLIAQQRGMLAELRGEP